MLNDDDKQVPLELRAAFDGEVDTPELETSILRAVNGPHSLLTEGELRGLAAKALEEHQARDQKFNT
jgi:hypothetical protein